MTDRYRELQGLRDAVSSPVLLDGEIVALDADSKPDFAALWFRSRGSASDAARVCFMPFDVLEVADEVLTDWPYRERCGALEALALNGPHCSTPEVHIGDVAASSPPPPPTSPHRRTWPPRRSPRGSREPR
jgi:bifunctional non-homologous end joining protein LigD